MLISLIVVPGSQCMHASNQIVHFKRTQFLIAYYTPIKLGGNVGPHECRDHVGFDMKKKEGKKMLTY